MSVFPGKIVHQMWGKFLCKHTVVDNQQNFNFFVRKIHRLHFVSLWWDFALHKYNKKCRLESNRNSKKCAQIYSFAAKQSVLSQSVLNDLSNYEDNPNGAVADQTPQLHPYQGVLWKLHRPPPHYWIHLNKERCSGWRIATAWRTLGPVSQQHKTNRSFPACSWVWYSQTSQVNYSDLQLKS